MFVVILNYTKPLEEVDKFTCEHRAYLDILVNHGVIVVSGRQVSQDGGVIMANVSSRAELDGLLAEDPYQKQGLATYTVYEFTPTKFQPALKDICQKPAVRQGEE